MTIEMVEAAPAATPSTTSDPTVTTQATKAAAAVPTTWLDTLPDDLKTHPTLTKYKTDVEAHKGHVELAKALGQRMDGMVKIPGEKATPEDWAAYRKALGVPEKPDGYTMTLPEGVAADPQTLAAFRAEAHDMGLTPRQVERLVKFDLGRLQSMQRKQSETADAAYQASEKALRDSWGGEFDTRLALVTRFVEQYGEAGLVDELEMRGKANNPKLLRLLSKVALDYNERRMIQGDTGARRLDEVKARLAQVIADPGWRTQYDNPAKYQALLKEKMELVAEIDRREQEARRTK
jgi:hypothetical protein